MSAVEKLRHQQFQRRRHGDRNIQGNGFSSAVGIDAAIAEGRIVPVGPAMIAGVNKRPFGGRDLAGNPHLFRDVLPDEREVRMLLERREVVAGAGEEVVDGDHFVVLGQETLA